MAHTIPISMKEEDSYVYSVMLKDCFTQKSYDYAFFITEEEAIKQMVYFLKSGRFAVVVKKAIRPKKKVDLLV